MKKLFDTYRNLRHRIAYFVSSSFGEIIERFIDQLASSTLLIVIILLFLKLNVNSPYTLLITGPLFLLVCYTTIRLFITYTKWWWREFRNLFKSQAANGSLNVPRRGQCT